MFNLDKLIPSLVARSILDIDFSMLAGLGRTKVLADLDGTLAAVLSEKYDQRVIDHLLAAQASGFITDICIFSNTGLACYVPRVRRIAARLNAKHMACYWPFPMKPSEKAFRSAMATIGGNADNTVMIGDQLRKDILGANRIGMMSILVETVPPIPFWKMRTHKKDALLCQKIGIKF